MQHDPLLSAMVRAIYDDCYPNDEWAPAGFEEAERLHTIHYRQSVDAAFQVKALGAVQGEQLALFSG